MVIDSIKENMRMSTIVRGSLEDFSYLYGCNDMEMIYRNHISPYCKCFICTDGEKPLHLFTPGMHACYPAKKIETVSTIGAGDNFNAGFIYGLHRHGLVDAAAFPALKEEDRPSPLMSALRYTIPSVRILPTVFVNKNEI